MEFHRLSILRKKLMSEKIRSFICSKFFDLEFSHSFIRSIKFLKSTAILAFSSSRIARKVERVAYANEGLVGAALFPFLLPFS